MGSGSSSAYRLSKEEAAALNTAVTEAPGLKQKLEHLQAQAAEAKEEAAKSKEEAAKSKEEAAKSKEEVAALQKKLKELQAQKASGVETSAESEGKGHQAEAKAAASKDNAQASEAASSKVGKEADDPEDAEADKAAAANCGNIHDAALDGNVAAVRHFLRAEPSCIEGSSLNSLRPLHWAAESGHMAVVQLLLDEGADLEAKTDDGETPLHRAALNGHLSVVERLLRAGAAVDAATNAGGTPLHWATAQDHLSVVETLLRAGAAVDAATNAGETPLYLVALNGHLPVVERLLGARAEVDAANNDGETPLYLAALNGDLSVVETLLRAGAAVDAATNAGQKPYDLAKRHGHREVMGVLDPVFVALLSGRDCRCSSFSERTLSDLKDEAEQKLAVVIKSLIGPDHQPLDEKKRLEELEIEGGFTLTAVVEAPEGENEGDVNEELEEATELAEDHEGQLHHPRHFIEFLITADVRLVRLEFLIELTEAGQAMPRRQEAETMHTKSGATALVELQEYRRLHVDEFSGHVSLDAGGQMTTVHFRSVSHMWESMQHPDPWRHQLGLICEKHRELLGTGLTWVFIDVICLHQYKRNKSQEISFQSALQMMHMLYSHEIVQVDILQDLTPENMQHEGSVLAYDEATDAMKLKPISELRLNPTPHALRGWCQAEKEWARLRNMLQGSGIPTPPELFRKRMVNMQFTHRNDAEGVLELQAKVFNAKISGTTHLHLEHLTANDLESLHEALPYYRHLKYVVVNGNALRGREAVAVIECGAMDIQMESCELADDDAEMMAEALVKAVRLKCLSLNRNRIGRRGLEALRKAMQERPDLQLTMEEQIPWSKTEGDDVLIATGKQIEDI